MAREAAGLPATYRKLQGHAISANFRAATAVVSAPLPRPSSKEALVRVLWAGVNASDLNWTNAKVAHPSIRTTLLPLTSCACDALSLTYFSFSPTLP